MRRARPSRRGQAGFTYVELLLVLVILATVAAVVGARLGAGLDSDRQQVAARDLAATLRLASDRARLGGRRVRVAINLELGTVAVEEESDPLDAPDEWSAIGLTWARKRTLEKPARLGELVIEADDPDLLQAFEAGDLSEFWIIFDGEGIHTLELEEGVLDDEPEEGVLIMLRIDGAEGDEPLYLRLEPTEEVRVWSEAEQVEHQQLIEEQARIAR